MPSSWMTAGPKIAHYSDKSFYLNNLRPLGSMFAVDVSDNGKASPEYEGPDRNISKHILEIFEFFSDICAALPEEKSYS